MNENKMIPSNSDPKARSKLRGSIKGIAGPGEEGWVNRNSFANTGSKDRNARPPRADIKRSSSPARRPRTKVIGTTKQARRITQ